LRYSFDLPEDAELVEKAVSKLLDTGLRTDDIMGNGMTRVSTSTMGEALVTELDKLAV
ncbi:uncharacterized protein METZ01_LOCUS488875, partial [marine metagenome]